jgi:hypothetical protein
MSRGTKWVLEPSMARQCTQNAHNAVHNADRRYLMTQPALDVYDVDVADIWMEIVRPVADKGLPGSRMGTPLIWHLAMKNQDFLPLSFDMCYDRINLIIIHDLLHHHIDGAFDVAISKSLRPPNKTTLLFKFSCTLRSRTM